MNEIPLKKKTLKELYTLKSFLLMLIGVAFAVVALKIFMMPNEFLDGGFTGVSLLLYQLYHLKDYHLSFLLLVFNSILLLLSFSKEKRNFTIRCFIAISLLAMGLNFLPEIPLIKDKLLVAVFGGSLLGVGMGTVIRSGAVLDGIEIIADYITKKTGFSAGEVILFFNSLIFFTAASRFGLPSAMYSIITYFTALKMANYVSSGIDEFICVNIVSKKPEYVKHLLSIYFQKAITVYKGERGYLPDSLEIKSDCDIVAAIVTRLELIEIKDQIHTIDPEAFIYITNVKETKGGIIKQKIFQ